ncbi:hypothetical protein SNE40_019405 [Patella caerulea]|uniref:Uncharacterized protein n=1 Tax=Patella caerulea TaxID=87958 RepID=A0AAN8J749_PATCE
MKEGRRQYVNTNEVTELGRINAMPYCTPKEISMDNFRSINLPETYINERDPIHLLPNLVWCLRSPTPGWSGFMQTVEDGPHPGKSSFTFLPMIDLNPSDMSCIYSTLHYINNLARKYNVTPTVNFDQPLYWKAKIIVANERDDICNIFLRLGGFHIESIGHLMGGSGLKELLECVYERKAVTHMISGKAVSRAI